MRANSGDILNSGKKNPKIQYEGFRLDQRENDPWQRLLESVRISLLRERRA